MAVLQLGTHLLQRAWNPSASRVPCQRLWRSASRPACPEASSSRPSKVASNWRNCEHGRSCRETPGHQAIADDGEECRLIACVVDHTRKFIPARRSFRSRRKGRVHCRVIHLCGVEVRVEGVHGLDHRSLAALLNEECTVPLDRTDPHRRYKPSTNSFLGFRNHPQYHGDAMRI